MSEPTSDTPEPDAAPSASFGYRDVPAAEKAGMVGSESVAPRTT